MTPKPKSMSVALVSNHNNIFLSNIQLFEDADMPFVFVGCEEDELSKQSFISERYIFQGHSQCNGQIDNLLRNEELLNTLPNFVLFEEDDWMRQVANSNLTDELKKKLLPVKNPKYFDFVGSKIGQIKLFAELGIAHPQSQIINVAKEALLPYPFIAKKDRWGGGSFCKTIENFSELESFISYSKDKILVQKIIKGEEFSAEPFYRNGELIFVSFSRMKMLIGGNGPSARRDFLPTVPDQVVKCLQIIGHELNFNGMANCSFMYDPNCKEFLIFEFDTRLNTWAHIAIDLGFNPSEYFKTAANQNLKLKTETVFIDWNRWLVKRNSMNYPNDLLKYGSALIELIILKIRRVGWTSSYPLVQRPLISLGSKIIFKLLIRCYLKLPIKTQKVIKYLKLNSFARRLLRAD
jgi:predicted ATP-grasp superfamily ATP-dependent carboligase